MSSCYRWVVLGTGVVAQASSAAVLQGLPGLAPVLREEYGLSLTGIGVLLASVTLGLLATLVLWGALADRYGERRVMTLGLLLAAGALTSAVRADTVLGLGGSLVLAGAACSSVNAASGRSVLGWFGPGERGFAMGVRQTALPVGAGLAAAVLPPLADARGLDAAFGVLVAATLVSAVLAAVLVREGPEQAPREAGGTGPLRDPRIRRLALVSGLLVVPQFAVVAFLVLYLVDEQGVAVATAALLLAAVQLLGGAGRIVAGSWSDRVGRRLGPLRSIAASIVALFVLVSLLAAQGGRAVVPVLLLAGVVAISWNGLAFTAVGELAGPGRAGTALGVQNTAVAAGAAVTPPLLGTVVEATAWPVAYALAGAAAVAAVVLLRQPVRDEALSSRAAPR